MTKPPSTDAATRPSVVRGIGAAAGIAIGPIWIHEPPSVPAGEPAAAGEDPLQAIERLGNAAALELEGLADRLRAIGRVDDADIFEAQAMIATDATLLVAAAARAREGLPLAEALSAKIE